MMAHGYLRDWDEDWGERERAEREWRGPDRGRSDHERQSGFMLGEGDDRNRRAGDFERNYGGRGDWERSPRDFRSLQDDHYRSWRDRQMAALDRDYADYCREREQQFHQDFDQWRRERAGNPEPLRTGMTQTGISHDPSGEFQLTTESIVGPVEPDAVSDATLGTNSAEGPPTGRSRVKPAV